MKHPVCRSYWIISLFITDIARVPDLEIREGGGGAIFKILLPSKLIAKTAATAVKTTPTKFLAWWRD